MTGGRGRYPLEGKPVFDSKTGQEVIPVDGGALFVPRERADAGEICPQCGLKFSRGYPLEAHRQRDALGKPYGPCLDEAQLPWVLGLFCFDKSRSPRWYSATPAAYETARDRLWRGLVSGTVMPEQLRYVKLWPHAAASLGDVLALLVKSQQIEEVLPLKLNGQEGP